MRTRACLVGGAIVAIIASGANGASALAPPTGAGFDAALHGRSVPLPQTTTSRVPFAPCPVAAPRHYYDDFGEPRYVGGFHRHQGIDIMAPRGAKIFAPFDGIAKVSVSWAGGVQVTLTDRYGNFVFNAHLTRTAHLGRVKAGTVIGHVGNSGDAMGGSTHDHFEWHPRGGPAVDPFRLLNMVCR